MLREWDNLNFRLGAYLWQHHRWWQCIVTNSRLSLSSLSSSLRWNNLNFRLGSYLWHQLREPSLSPHSTSCKRFFQTEGVWLEVNRGVLGEKGGGRIGVKRGRFGVCCVKRGRGGMIGGWIGVCWVKRGTGSCFSSSSLARLQCSANLGSL